MYGHETGDPVPTETWVKNDDSGPTYRTGDPVPTETYIKFSPILAKFNVSLSRDRITAPTGIGNLTHISVGIGSPTHSPLTAIACQGTR